ncbi:5'-3' exoribonuclease 2, partial [Nowakowskiella sp. JEL0078]
MAFTKISKSNFTGSCVEEHPYEINGVMVPVNLVSPNPNGVELDNLYLDMNGIIHPCCHPEDKPAPETEEEMFVEIFKYIDRIMGIIRPRKVLYMAIDGVAPRAKMNQQRSRRFRASLDAQLLMEEEAKVREEWVATSDDIPKIEKKEHFDSNCITPGTPFMANLAIALRYYIAERLTNNPGWRDLKVILSDANVPGEGEHKIMDFIRRQRSRPEHNPNTQHVLYGLDADLIMLALATHEPYFKILREDVFFAEKGDKGCFICGEKGHMAAECTGKKEAKDLSDKSLAPIVKPFLFLHINILREYLEFDLKMQNLPFGWDLERAIDDWVFMCFFVGNDFIPHIPSLEIREGAIDKIMELWKKNLAEFGGYVTENGDIDLTKAQILLEGIGKIEDNIFVKRRDDEKKRNENSKRRKQEQQKALENQRLRPTAAHMAEMLANTPTIPLGPTRQERDRFKLDFIKSDRVQSQIASINQTPVVASAEANKAAADQLRLNLINELKVPEIDELSKKRKVYESVESNKEKKVGEVIEEVIEESGFVDDDEEMIEEDSGVVISESLSVSDPVSKLKKIDVNDEEEPIDVVRLWETGWKERYYQSKFEVSDTDMEFKKQYLNYWFIKQNYNQIIRIVTKYVEGLCWVLKYYYQGVQSWKWFYPYHYAPFASDFTPEIMQNLDVKFDLGTPFRPIDQLMGVFPAASKKHIPEIFHALMTDSNSSIIDFYPEKFPIDMNGKKLAWQGISLLPFIDEKRLLDAMEPLYVGISEEDRQRNSLGPELLFIRSTNSLYDSVSEVYTKKSTTEPVIIDANLSQNMTGEVLQDSEVCIPGCMFQSPLPAHGMEDIEDNQSLSMVYKMPQFPEGYIFVSRLLPTVKMPVRELTHEDEYWLSVGGRGRGRGRGRGNGNVRGRGGRGGGLGFAERSYGNDNNTFEYEGGWVPKRSRYENTQSSNYSTYRGSEKGQEPQSQRMYFRGNNQADNSYYNDYQNDRSYQNQTVYRNDRNNQAPYKASGRGYDRNYESVNQNSSRNYGSVPGNNSNVNYSRAAANYGNKSTFYNQPYAQDNSNVLPPDGPSQGAGYRSTNFLKPPNQQYGSGYVPSSGYPQYNNGSYPYVQSPAPYLSPAPYQQSPSYRQTPVPGFPSQEQGQPTVSQPLQSNPNLP